MLLQGRHYSVYSMIVSYSDLRAICVNLIVIASAHYGRWTYAADDVIITNIIKIQNFVARFARNYFFFIFCLTNQKLLPPPLCYTKFVHFTQLLLVDVTSL